MGIPILIIGESGSGKSTSIRTLNPKETFIIKVINKPLPFRKGAKDYTLASKENNPSGNLFITRNHNQIISSINAINKHYPHIKTIVIDDFQYSMSFEYMDRATEIGYTKFTEIAQHVCDILTSVLEVRSNLNVVFLSHSEITENGRVKCKTVGKLIDDKVNVEGLFTIVLNSLANDGKYMFLTQNLGNNAAKSPMEMFKDTYIDNDLNFVLTKANEYYNVA